MTDTPETDDLARGNHVVPTEFAEQLERERDDLIASLNFHADLNKELIRKRDRLTEALEYILGIGLTQKTIAKADKALKNND
jgi:hypothetical protein